MFAILDGNAPPNVRKLRVRFQRAFEQFRQAVGAFRQYLKRVMIGNGHYVANGVKVVERNVAMKKIAHRVYKNSLRLFPLKWKIKHLRHEAKVKSLLVRVSFHAAPALGECCSITMRATWADHRAATDGIPSCVGPFNFGFIAHKNHRSQRRCRDLRSREAGRRRAPAF